MKTKHIFSTILMAAFVAACSNEDLQLENNLVAVNDRIELGDVKLTIGEADSRFVVGDNFNDLLAEVEDKVGAALIDVLDNTVNNTTEAKYNYKITSFISTNYAFEYNGSLWTTPAKMVEGNYMFYAPYNANHATRKPIVAELDAVQQLVADGEGVDELSAIKQMIASGKVMNVSHEFIAASDEADVETALVPIYAYPYITLTNDYAPSLGNPAVETPMDLVIDQIVIKNVTNATATPITYGSFTIAAPFDFADGYNVISTTTGFVGGLSNFSYIDTNDNNKTKTKQGAFAKKLGKGAYTSALLGNAESTSAAIVVKAPQGFTLAKNGGTMSFYAVIPAEVYEALELEIYTDKGVFTKVVEGATISAGKRYPESEYKEDGKTLKAPSEGGEIGAGALFTVNINDTEESEAATLVASTEDLVTFVKNAPSTIVNGSTTIANHVSVSALTPDIEVNAAVMSAIKAKSKSGWTIDFTTPVTISTNLDSSNKKLNFNGGAIVDGATVTLGGCAELSALTVESGNVTINGANVKGASTNKGTLVLNSDIAGEITNKGTITIADPISARITNNGSDAALTIGDGNKTDGVAKYFANLNVTNTDGEIEIKANTTATVVSNAAEKTIDNYGSLKINSNNGTINNYGTLTGENSGLIVMGAGSTATGIENNARINNTNNGNVTTADGKTGVIYYQFSEDVEGQLIAKTRNYNTIVLKNITWTPSASQEIGTEDAKINVEVYESTISIWDPAIVITIHGNLTNKDGDSDATTNSVIEGVNGAVIEVTGSIGDGIDNSQNIAKVKTE